MSANNETQIEPRHLSRFLNRRTPPHIFTLILLAGMGALNMNLILPSLPAMTEYFKTDYAIMQLAISAYLGMTAILQLIVGPLSDRYGRRPVIIFGMAVFVLSSLAAAFATSVELFMLARLTQATVVSGYALSRAVVRDMFPMEQAASMIGYVTMGMTLIP
ncbi:MAG: MFS transporter, partial [Salaquimonas sp.]